ncbi:MAG: hypothetical protein WCA89_04815 [Terracidiphilus sp.]|jgi:hypothetical protein
MTMRLFSLLLFVTLGSSSTLFSQATPKCTEPSRLTDDDARILLYVAPVSIAARRAGTDVDLEQSSPSKQFPAADYFVAAIVSQKPTSGSVLDNGILGYYAVDKRSGVVESITDFTRVNSKELSRIQAWMRHSHCIQMVKPRK